MRATTATTLALVLFLSRSHVASALRYVRGLVADFFPSRKLLRTVVRSSNANASVAQLVSAQELRSRLQRGGDRRPIVIEVVAPKDEGSLPRIPGSKRVWRPDYERAKSATQPLDGLAPTREAFEQFAQRLGIHDDSDVVLVSAQYDDTRLWWLFTAFGKRHVYLLDGGFAAWKLCTVGGTSFEREAPGGPRVTEADAARGTWKAQPFCCASLATMAEVEALRTSSSAPRLWDVRTEKEHDGEVTMAGAAQPGRIPWATRRVEWSMFRREDGTWLPPAQIRELARRELGGATPSERGVAHVFYCQSGVRTTQLMFGMCLAGWPLEELKNYDGSWIEWSHLADNADIVCG